MQQKRDPAAGMAILAFMFGVACLYLWLPLGPPSLATAAGTPTMAAVGAVLIQTPFAVEPPPAAAPTDVPLPIAPRLAGPVTAYAAPDGATIGPIEAGRAYRVLARSGAGWAQIDAAGSGVVWVRADASLDLASAPDLATPIPPPTSAPLRQIIYIESTPEPNDPPQPTDPPPPIPTAGCPPNCHRTEASGPPAASGGHPEAAPQMDGGAPHASFGTHINDSRGTSPSDPYQTQNGALLIRTATP